MDLPEMAILRACAVSRPACPEATTPPIAQRRSGARKVARVTSLTQPASGSRSDGPSIFTV